MLSNNNFEINNEFKLLELSNFFNKEILKEKLEVLNLKKIENLETFALNNVILKDSDNAKLLIDLLSNNNLKKLYFNSSPFNNETLKLLTDFLANNQTIEEFSLQNAHSDFENGIEVEVEAEGLCNFIKKSNSLKKLALINNECLAPNMKNICEALITSTSINELDLSHNNFNSPENIDALVNLTKENKIIKKLNLSGIEIDSQGITKIIDALKDNFYIEEVDISNIHLNGKCTTIALANLIKENKIIKKLHLNNTSLNENGINSLIEALEENTSIKELFLDTINFNNIENVKALAKLINNNKTITKIDLGTTNLSEEGICLIGEALKNNTSIQAIYLSHNDFSKEKSENALMELIKESRSIKNLYLYNIGINQDGIQKFGQSFCQALEKNETIMNIRSNLLLDPSEEYKPFVDKVKKLLERNKQLQDSRYMFARMIKRLKEKEQQIALPNEICVEVLKQATENPNEMKYYRERVLKQNHGKSKGK